MPVEAGETVLDLGAGSGYAARALRAAGAARAYGLDGSPEMARNARSYTDDDGVGFVVGDFEALPFAADSIDHAFSMEALYYDADPVHALEELRRVLRSGGTFFCAVNYYEENRYAHDWQASIDVEMTRWDREVDIPPAEAFPAEGFPDRESMVERYRELGTLLTVGVVP